MLNIYITPFLLFLIAAWLYYSRNQKKQNAYYAEQRKQYMESHPQLPEEQRTNIRNGEPWPGMKTELLIDLFGEPGRKRVLDQSVTRFIWSYSDLFVYITGDEVVEWKRK
ncbi:MAG: hypothetical protein JXR86_11160 [Spirochaetales bacterium]|nr:hypothetical protein [Spirochaetales bacterium]